MLAAAWFVLLVLNVLRHRDKNAIVIGTAVAAFLVIGAISRRQETKASRNRHLK